MIFDGVFLKIAAILITGFILVLNLLILRRVKLELTVLLKATEEDKSLMTCRFDQICRDFDCQDTRLKEITKEIDELKLQVGIINGVLPTAIFWRSSTVGPDKPYVGAKRGPKPRKTIENSQ